MSALQCESVVLRHFNFNFRQILIDEIALEGLEGITLSSLWKRMEHRISSQVTDKIKTRFWHTILTMKDVYLFQLPEPLPCVEIRDRFTIVDEETGDLKEPDQPPDGPYEYSPVAQEYGSCKYYNTRKPIPSHMLLEVPYLKICGEYEDSLVLVASLEQRWRALSSNLPISNLQQITPIQYCILELVGKARENGQMTTGNSNLANFVKDPKNLFYNRRNLKNLGLIKEVCVTQAAGTKGIKSILVRLNRFHKPSILSVPKIGKMHQIVEYLRTRPNYEEKTDELYKNKLLTIQQGRRLKKRNNVFDFAERPVLNDDGPPPRKKSRDFIRKKRVIFIATKSDESSQSEDEMPEEPIKCQYNIGVGLMRQAYERLLEAGLRGLSQLELGQILGLEFYASRTLCKVFKAKKIVREYFEDKGKQRISRYVAVAAGHNDTKYIAERNKFLEYINQSIDNSTDLDSAANTSKIVQLNESDTAKTNVHIEEEVANVAANPTNNKNISPLLTSLESKKSLTLRQLRFGSGILKIIKEKQCVSGYQPLSNLVAKEIKEPPMVTKALKVFLQKLVASGHIKIYKVKCPGDGSALSLICAPHLKPTDPIIQAKYGQVVIKAMAKKPRELKKDMADTRVKPLSMYIYPRYMKIQKLHETIIKMVYFEKIDRGSNMLPEGFLSVPEFMPEMTVKFAISNMSTVGIAEIAHLRLVDSYLNLKLKDAPPEISHGLMQSKSLKNALRMNLKALAMHGLIQLIYQPDVQTADYTNNTLVSFLFYVNRNAKIINTVGKWPRELLRSENLERSYYFETFDDVKRYWKDVFEISVNTKITVTENRNKKTLNPPVRKEHEVKTFDNGDRYGDWSGPCGFDSCFFMEISRLWRTYYVRENKQAPVKKKPQIKKPPKLSKSKQPIPKKPIKKKVAKVNPVMKIRTVKGKKRVPESTVFWSIEEDRIIIMCQAAITIASPSSQPGCLRVRNSVAKDILSIRDPLKTTSICHRRALMLQLNPSLMHERDSLLNEMRRRKSLIQKYHGLIKKLRIRHSANMTKFMMEARIPMLELVWLIWQVSKSETYNKKMPCVALDVETFHKNFNIFWATANKTYYMYKSPDLEMLREAVFVSIMSSFNSEVKPEAAKRIYRIFKTFPENSLRIVIDQLRRIAAVSAKEKILNNQMHRLHLEDIVQSAYKISAHYQRRWIGRLNSEFADALAKLMREEFPCQNIKGSAEINCVLSELQVNNVLYLITEIEPEIVDASGLPTVLDESITVIEVESKHKLKSGSVTWKKMDANWNTNIVSTLYSFPNFDKFMQDMAKNAVVCIDEEQMYDLNDEIVSILHEKGESGTTFEHLENTTGYDSADLAKRLASLESENIIKRVGLSNNTIILLKFIKKWTLKLESTYIICIPWLTLDLDIRYDVFLEWTGVIVNKIFENPGVSIAVLSDMLELITRRAVQDACTFLHECKVLNLQIVKYPEPDLFSSDDILPEICEFHPYASADNILAFPVKDTIMKYALLRKIIMEKYGYVK